ncbi:MAG: ornithine cyclodeaminase [Pseudomonadota bacterium]
MNLLSPEELAKLVKRHGFDRYILDLIDVLKEDFSRWNEFDKIPRLAFHVPDGVIELMPIADKKLFSFKYVNGHPKNPLFNKSTVVATGQLSRIEDGFPLMFSGMTIPTALRTAATSALASDLLARKDARTIALIGTGAQSEFQVLAHKVIRDIKTVRYYDIDAKAMNKFANNMRSSDLELIACDSNEEAVKGSDIIIVCTACKQHVDVILNDWVRPGMHINGLGGDCPGKTEVELSVLDRAKIVVEFFDQSLIEGEIQRYSRQKAEKKVYAELWQLITGDKVGREHDQEITLFDSVGFALEDFSILRFTYQLCQKYHIGEFVDIIPPLQDPKDLFSILNV